MSYRILLLIFAIFGSALSCLGKDFERSVSLDAKGRVSLDNYKGRIVVSTWDQPRFDITVRLEADGSSPRDREVVNGTEIEFDATASSIRVKTRYPKLGGWGWDNVSLPLATYQVRMPRTAELRIKDYKSEIEVEGLAAALDLDTYKGDVRIRQQDGPLTLKTYKSDVRLDFARFGSRAVLEGYRGKFDVTMPRDSKFEISSDVGRHGSVDSSFPLTMPGGSSRSFRSNSFRATVNGGGPVLTLKGYRAEYRIR